MNGVRSFAHYNLDTNDYTCELKDNTFFIKELAKDRSKTNKTARTVVELQNLFSNAKPSGLTPQNLQEIKKFVKCLQEKVECKIVDSSFLGKVILLIQKLFGMGAVSEIYDLNEKLNQLPTTDQPKIQITIKNTLSEFYDNYKDIIDALGIHFSSVSEFKQKLNDLLAQDQGFALLENLLKLKLPKMLSDQSCALLLECIPPNITFQRIQKRHLQIGSAHFETLRMSALEILQLAFFIEVRIHKADKVSKEFFRAQDYQLPRDVQFNPETEEVYVLADLKISILRDEGTYKNVGACVRLAKDNFSLHPEIAAYLMTRIDGLKVYQIKDDMRIIKREIAVCIRFREIVGVSKFITAAKFFDTIPIEGKVPRMNLIFEKAAGNLFRRVFENPQPITFQEELTIAKFLISALSVLHAENVIHGDLKLQNALFMEDFQHIITKALLCDFGCAYEFNAQQPDKTKVPEVYLWGHAGTDIYSPPELYGKLKFKGDYFKIDIWALGCLLYQLHFRKKLPWQASLEEAIRKHFDDETKAYKNKAELAKAQHAFQDTVCHEIEHELRRMQPASQEAMFVQLIFEMLRLDPKARFSIFQIVSRFEEIVNPKPLARPQESQAQLVLQGLEASIPDEKKS